MPTSEARAIYGREALIVASNTTRRFGGANMRRARSDDLRRAHLIDA
jgi:hypothetical protein